MNRPSEEQNKPLHQHTLPTELEDHDKANDGYKAEISLKLLSFSHAVHIMGIGRSPALLLLELLLSIVIVKSSNIRGVYI